MPGCVPGNQRIEVLALGSRSVAHRAHLVQSEELTGIEWPWRGMRRAGAGGARVSGAPGGTAARGVAGSLYADLAAAGLQPLWTQPGLLTQTPNRSRRTSGGGRRCGTSRGDPVTWSASSGAGTGGYSRCRTRIWAGRRSPRTRCGARCSSCAAGNPPPAHRHTPAARRPDPDPELDLARASQPGHRRGDLSRDRTRCPRCPASACTTRCRHRRAVAERVPRRARPAVRIRPQVRPGALHPRARCRPARQDGPDS
jgi:hypothetical protein